MYYDILSHIIAITYVLCYQTCIMNHVWCHTALSLKTFSTGTLGGGGAKWGEGPQVCIGFGGRQPPPSIRDMLLHSLSFLVEYALTCYLRSSRDLSRNAQLEQPQQKRLRMQGFACQPANFNACCAERPNEWTSEVNDLCLPAISHLRHPPVALVGGCNYNYSFEAALPQRVVTAQRYKKYGQTGMIHQALCKPPFTFLTHPFAHDFE